MEPARSPTAWTLANRITLMRILCVPAFVLLVIYHTMELRAGRPDSPYRLFALGLFAAAALTDALDGYIARVRREISDLGRILDPLADKSLLLSGLVVLTRPDLANLTPHIPVYLTLLVISRDVILICGSVIVHLFAGRLRVRPHALGKIATFLQMAVILWVLAAAPVRGFALLAAAAAAFTLASGLLYILDGVRQLEGHGPHRDAAPPPPGA